MIASFVFRLPRGRRWDLDLVATFAPPQNELRLRVILAVPPARRSDFSNLVEHFVSQLLGICEW